MPLHTNVPPSAWLPRTGLLKPWLLQNAMPPGMTFLPGCILSWPTCLMAFRYVVPFDLIVSNPPYVSEPEFSGLAPEISRYEPTSALRGGGELGLDLIRRICRRFQDYLKPGGSLLVEIGQGQAEILQHDLESGFFGQFSFIPDYSGIKRVLHLRSPKES